MESKRQQKFSKLIQKELSDIFQRDTKSLFSGTFVTVTQVRVSPDFSSAKVYLSFMLAKNKETLLQTIKENTGIIKKLLGESIRKQVRIVPNLHFHLDDTLDYASNIDAILSKINVPPAPDKEEDKDEEGDE